MSLNVAVSAPSAQGSNSIPDPTLKQQSVTKNSNTSTSLAESSKSASSGISNAYSSSLITVNTITTQNLSKITTFKNCFVSGEGSTVRIKNVNGNDKDYHLTMKNDIEKNP